MKQLDTFNVRIVHIVNNDPVELTFTVLAYDSNQAITLALGNVYTTHIQSVTCSKA